MTKETTAAQEIEGLFRSLTTKLIGHPVALKLSTTVEGKNIVIRARVHADDQGKVLGAKRKTFNALSLLLGIAAMRNGHGFRFILLEPNEGERLPATTFQPAEKWNSAPLLELLGTVAEAMFPGAWSVSCIETNGERPKTDITLLYKREGFTQADEFTLDEAVSHLFHAIGKSLGRYIYVTTKRT